jgi:hypothetical protein
MQGADAAKFRLVSLVIVLVLGLQFAAVVTRSGKWGWPFIDYPMYSDSIMEGDRRVVRHADTATTADGDQITVTPDELGVNLWVFERWAAALIRSAQAEVRAADDKQAPPPDSWALRSWLKSTSLFQLLKSRPDPDLAVVLTEHYQKGRGANIVRLRVEDTPVVLRRDGQISAPPNVVEIELPRPAAD